MLVRVPVEAAMSTGRAAELHVIRVRQQLIRVPRSAPGFIGIGQRSGQDAERGDDMGRKSVGCFTWRKKVQMVAR